MLTTMTFFINEARLLLIVINNFSIRIQKLRKEKGSVLLFFFIILFVVSDKTGVTCLQVEL